MRMFIHAESRRWLYVALFLLVSAGYAAGQERLLRVDDFPAQEDRDKINQAFQAAKTISGSKRLIFSSREYRIRPADCDTFAPVVGVDGVKDLTIDGNGAILVATDALDCTKGYFFKISNFVNVQVRRLILTYRPLPHAQGVIIRVNQAENMVTVRLDHPDEGLEKLRRTPNAEFWCRAGQREAPYLPKAGSPSWMAVATNAGGKLDAQEDAPNVWTLRAGYFNPDKTLGGAYCWVAGDPFVVWKRGAQDGFCFEKGDGLVLEDVKVESALHFAIKLRGVRNAQVKRCQVTPEKGRMISGSADGIDVQQSSDITIDGCTVTACGDDMISFLNFGHGYNGTHYEEKLPASYPETNHSVILRNNNLTGGNRNGILLLASDARLESNQILHARQYGLKFCGDNTVIRNNTFTKNGTFIAYRHITDELNTGIVCSEEWPQKNVEITGNCFEDWQHMPALLLKSVSKVEVRGNTFRLLDEQWGREKPNNPYLQRDVAICVTNGTFKLKEYQCSAVEITNNTIVGIPDWAHFQEAYYLHGEHTDIRFRNNTFR